MRTKTGINRRQSGFTLIELLVVIVILAILAAFVIPRVTGRVDDARIAKAVSDIASFKAALERYKLDTSTYPSSDQGLAALVSNVAGNPKWAEPYIEKVPSDPWGNQYLYIAPGSDGRPFDIVSVGPDAQQGTGDDITSYQ